MGRVHETIQKAVSDQGAALLGVLNVTPDSFFDGGRYLDPKRALAHVDQLLQEGADLIEIGAESSRPGSEPVPADEQLRRLMPALRYAVGQGAIVSLDTTSVAVAREGLAQGAQILNDVSCLSDPSLARVAADFAAPLILMHSRGSMRDQRFSEYPESGYRDIVRDVAAEWLGARHQAEQAGLDSSLIWFDPGLGFHKNAQQSFEIMARLSELTTLCSVMVVGASRKSFLGSLDQSPPDGRLGSSLAAALHSARQGAHVIRVHDVAPTRQALRAARAMEGRPTLPLERGSSG